MEAGVLAVERDGALRKDPPRASPTPPPAIANPQAGADLAAWLAVAAGALGAFMATLDISIVNASLPTIQGEIGATPSEGTWIGTSYLVAEIVVTPITAWLSRMLGLRRFMVIAATMFTAFSIMCGLSTDLTMMIFGRVGQGLAGGTLVPTALTIIATRLPPHQQPIGIAIFGGTMLLGPLTGPLLGGWITEAYSWRYAFFINVPVGIGLASLLILSLPRIAPDWSGLRDADWIGLLGITVGLGCLTVLLEEGHREQWFESALIVRLAVATAIGFLAVAWSQFRSDKPIIRLSLLRVPAFSACVAMMFMFGALLFGQSYIVPQFLAAIAGYNALQAGSVVFMPGLSSVIMMLAFPITVKLFDPRTSVVLGCLIAGASTWLLTGMTADSTGSAFILPQMIFGGGAAVASLTLQQSSIIAVPIKYADEASAIFMAARNLGGSIGLALIASFQEQRLDVHRWQMHASISANDAGVQQVMADNAAMLGGGPEGMAGALRMLDGRIQLDALVMSFNDIFLMLALGAVIIAPLALLLRGERSGSTSVMH